MKIYLTPKYTLYISQQTLCILTAPAGRQVYRNGYLIDDKPQRGDRYIETHKNKIHQHKPEGIFIQNIIQHFRSTRDIC